MTASLPCPIHARCGGCPAMPEGVEAALARKVERVAAALGRPVDRVHPSPRPLGYRARLRLRVGPDGRPGYHRPRSHDLVPVPACALARPELARVLDRLPPLPPGATVELRGDGRRVVLVVERGRRRGGAAGPGGSLAQDAGADGLVVDGRVAWGDPTLVLEVGGLRHRLGPDTFYQVNLEVNAALVAAVGEAVRSLDPTAVLDLYAGAGNLGLPLAAAGLPVTLVEASRPALADARRTAEAHGLAVTLRPERAERWRAGRDVFDVAILDPPRAGARGVLDEVLLVRPRGVVYVSCNPATLARDLRAAAAAGYRVERVEVFDMFPQTWHVETLVVLRRPDGPGRRAG